MRCSNCNSEMSENAKFCMSCGTKPIRDKKCKGCNSIMPLKAAICSDCGYILDEDMYLKKEGYDYDYFLLENISDEDVPLGPISVGGKWGFRNSSNQLVIPFEYDDVGTFTKLNDGTFVSYAKKDGQWGVINLDNEVIIPFIFYDTIDNIMALGSGRPSCAMVPAKGCDGWGRIFINRNLDIRFDLGSQEEFFERYPQGKEWLIKNEKYLGDIVK